MFWLKVHVGEDHQARDEDAEIVSGTVHLFRDVSTSAAILFGDIPECCSENLCIVGVPSRVDTFDFLQLTSTFACTFRKLQFIRSNDASDRQIILLKFDSQESANTFYTFFKGKPLLIEEAICHVISAVSVEYTTLSEKASEAPSGLTELPTCSICLERLDENISGIPTGTLEFCIFGPASSCPVCRYCLRLEKSTCSICPTRENLWVCMVCGFVGCGRYQEGHAIQHWKETKHSYSLELETQRIWDYVGDSYVHRIVQSRQDGNLLELSAPSSDSNDDCSSCSRAAESYGSTFGSKLRAMELEYNSLVATQFESQRQHYEERLAKIYASQEEDVAAAVAKIVATKSQKLEQRLSKVDEEFQFLEQVNQCLRENDQTWETQYRSLEERGDAQLRRRDQQIAALELNVTWHEAVSHCFISVVSIQVQGLMECLESNNKASVNKPAKALSKGGRKKG